MSTLVTRDNRLIPTTEPRFRDAWVVTAGGQGTIKLSGALTGTFETIYEASPNCAAVVNKLVRLIATLPVKVYDRPAPEDAPEEIRGHPVGDLLNRPAPRMGQAYWKQALVRSALVHGNGVLAKWRGPSMTGAPQALLAVAWPYVAAYAPLGCPVEWWSTTQTGMQRFFEVQDSVHLGWESQDLHGLGVSPLKPLAETIKLDDALRRYQSASMENGARPATAIIPPENFRYQANERELLRTEINRLHGGVDNAMKAALLAPGFKMEALSHTAVEAEVIAARNIGREEFAMVYDVPPPLIGDLTHATYSNISELHRALYITTLRPWLKLIEETLQRQLIDDEESWSDDIYVQFDLAEVLRGNKREELDAYAQAYASGLLTLNECREAVGLPPVDGEKDPEDIANQPMVATNNMTPISQAGEPMPTASVGVDPNELQPKPEKYVPQPRSSPLKESPIDT